MTIISGNKQRRYNVSTKMKRKFKLQIMTRFSFRALECVFNIPVMIYCHKTLKDGDTDDVTPSAIVCTSYIPYTYFTIQPIFLSYHHIQKQQNEKKKNEELGTSIQTRTPLNTEILNSKLYLMTSYAVLCGENQDVIAMTPSFIICI